ncbi:U1 small nuclear ribonucleoprotein [Glycine soja]
MWKEVLGHGVAIVLAASLASQYTSLVMIGNLLEMAYCLSAIPFRFDWLLTLTNKPKGYAFIEYFHTRDEKADGRKIEGQRGGGLGTTRVGGEEVNQQHFGREQQQSGLSRSEEPRAQEDHHGDRDREKSRERGKDRHRESEWSCERSSGRARDRDYRGDRHYRDWDRNMDRDRERERDRDVIVVESVIRIGIMTRTANMTVIVKEIGIMKLG